MKKFKNHIEEEVFNHHIVQGSTEKGKVTHTGTLRQMQKTIRDPKTPTDHVLVKTRHDLKTGDSWKKHMHAEDTADDLLKKKKKIAQTISHPGYDAESKNEGIFGATTAKKSRDKLFLAKSRGNTIKKDEPVNELSKDLLQRASQSAKKKAGQQRAVSKVAVSRVGDTSQPPGQNIKSKRADYQAAKKDYQAFKFDKAAKKKDESVEESTKPQSHEYFGSGPFSGGYNDVAASVMRVAEKAAKENPEENRGFEKMTDEKINKSVTDAYLEKVQKGS
jgi:hypothetical protein